VTVVLFARAIFTNPLAAGEAYRDGKTCIKKR